MPILDEKTTDFLHFLNLYKVLKNPKRSLLPTFIYLSLGTISGKANEQIRKTSKVSILGQNNASFVPFWTRLEFFSKNGILHLYAFIES